MSQPAFSPGSVALPATRVYLPNTGHDLNGVSPKQAGERATVHCRNLILRLVVGLTASASSADVVPAVDTIPANPEFLSELQSNTEPASELRLEDGRAWNRTSNFELDAQSALLILAYQAVAIGHAVDGQHDVVPLTVLGCDLRPDGAAGSVASTFFAPANHLWSASAAKPDAGEFAAGFHFATPSLELGIDPLFESEGFDEVGSNSLPTPVSGILSGIGLLLQP